MRRFSLWLGLLALGLTSQAAEPLPPKPSQFVTDGAGILSAQTVSDLNARLAANERETSNQVLVATFPKIPEGYAMEDFTQRTAEAWGVGQKEKDNGAVLFVFPNDRKLRIEVGYGLEGALPDALAKRIISDDITPSFKAGDFNGGITRGVEAILQASRGEYTASVPAYQESSANGFEPVFLIIFILVLFFVVMGIGKKGGSTVYGPNRRSDWSVFSGGSGGGSRSSGGGSSGGGFSGGGGSFGGGGASGGW